MRYHPRWILAVVSDNSHSGGLTRLRRSICADGNLMDTTTVGLLGTPA